jgi:glycerol uptake facilitator-like aquaporin
LKKLEVKKYISEFLGTAFLLMVIVGSGIMGEKLSGGNLALALLANAIATGLGLVVIIQCSGPISGAHLNPLVSLLETMWGRLKKKDLIGYWIAQFLGGIVGVLTAHAMFGLTIFEISEKHREGWGLGLSEFVATFGLICIIALPARKNVERTPALIAAYITSAYWFTSSTAFANPAVAIARSFTNTFCGIAPSGIAYFIIAEILGGLAAFWTVQRLEQSK